MSTAIRFDNVSRKFTLDDRRPGSFQELFLNIFRQQDRPSHQTFWALNDISFALPVGDSIGLIGSNGAGKSTLLKLIAGIIPPTSGRIEINGRVRALLELGAGFHGDLTGRENIFLNGTILGLRRTEIQQKLDEIIAFAELERFIDVPVRHYSSGMYLRLGFSVAIYTNPDILVVDEALAVGDQAFQTKCIQRINLLKAQGVTIVFVSHSLSLIHRLCNSALWLDKGQMKLAGPIEQVSDAYIGHVAAIRDKEQTQKATEDSTQRWGSGEIEIERVLFFNHENQQTNLLESGCKMTARIYYQAHSHIKNPCFGLAFYQAETGLHLSGPNSQSGNYDIPFVQGNGYVDFSVPHLPFLPGEYLVSAAVYDQKLEQAYDHRHQIGLFTVKSTNDHEPFGIIHIRAEWSCHDKKIEQASQASMEAR